MPGLQTTSGCEQAPQLPGNPRPRLALRVHGSEHDGRILSLYSPKCLVGTRPDCTLRLLAPGVQPRHCLITHVAEKSVVHAWSPDTRLNGRLITVAELRAGDLLTVGSVQFEVLPCTPQPPPVPKPAKQLGDHSAVAAQAQPVSTTAVRATEPRRLAVPSAESPDGEEASGQTSAPTDAVTLLHDLQRPSFRPADAGGGQKAPCEDLSAKPGAIAAALLAAMGATVDKNDEEGGETAASLFAGNRALPEHGAPNRAGQPPGADEGGTRREKEQGSPVDQAAQPPNATEALLTCARRPAAHAPSPAAAPNCEDEDSVENYMQQLLKRIRGDREAPPNPRFDGGRFSERTPPAEEVEPAVLEQVCPSVAAPEPPEPTEYVPRSAAPELGSNLAAMRELANQSARSAIDVCNKRRRNSTVVVKLLLALLTGAAAGGILWLDDGRQGAALVGAAGGLLVAVAWTCQALMTIRSLPANHRPSKRRHPEPAAAPPPAEAEPDQAEPSGELPESSRDGRPRRTLQPDPAGRFDSEAAGGLDVCEVP